jgi:hypothetical protein
MIKEWFPCFVKSIIYVFGEMMNMAMAAILLFVQLIVRGWSLFAQTYQDHTSTL